MAGWIVLYVQPYYVYPGRWSHESPLYITNWGVQQMLQSGLCRHSNVVALSIMGNTQSILRCLAFVKNICSAGISGEAMSVLQIRTFIMERAAVSPLPFGIDDPYATTSCKQYNVSEK